MKNIRIKILLSLSLLLTSSVMAQFGVNGVQDIKEHYPFLDNEVLEITGTSVSKNQNCTRSMHDFVLHSNGSSSNRKEGAYYAEKTNQQKKAWYIKSLYGPLGDLFSESLYTEDEEFVRINSENPMVKDLLNPIEFILEYISGEVLHLYLGELSSRTRFIFNSDKHPFLVGSPMLNNFKDLNDAIFNEMDEEELSESLQNNPDQIIKMAQVMSCIPYGCNITNTNVEKTNPSSSTIIDGKQLIGLENVLVAASMVNEKDLNSANLGVSETITNFIFAKVDHDSSLLRLDEPLTLSEIRQVLYEPAGNIYRIDFDNLLYAINNVTSVSDSKIEEAIENSFICIESLFEANEIKGKIAYSSRLQNAAFPPTVEGLKDYIKEGLKKRKLALRTLSQHLKLEKAILHNSHSEIRQLLATGIDPESDFHSFFDFVMPSEAELIDYVDTMAFEREEEYVQVGVLSMPKLGHDIRANTKIKTTFLDFARKHSSQETVNLMLQYSK